MTGHVEGRVQALFVHPVKSCAGIAVSESPIDDTGLDLDRAFMVTDEHGDMLSQRTLPKMALVRPTLRGDKMILRAPGMLALHVRLDAVEGATRARVWNDVVKAFDLGPLAAQWFSDFLGRSARLVRFDPEERRLSNRKWTGEIEAPTQFADAFALLVAGSASLADLNTRLAAPVGIERFRPNIVIDGLEPYDEDHLHEIVIAADEGPVVLRLVKPCVRCTVPNVDPVTAETSPEVGDALAGYRADPRMQGGITFGMNAIVVEGAGHTLRTGQPATASWRFD